MVLKPWIDLEGGIIIEISGGGIRPFLLLGRRPLNQTNTQTITAQRAAKLPAVKGQKTFNIHTAIEPLLTNGH